MLHDLLLLLLGAGLVSIGFLVAALTERIRNLRTPHEDEKTLPTPRKVRDKGQVPLAAETTHPMPVPRSPRAIRPTPGSPDDMDGDVIDALVAAGYKRPRATKAVWACSIPERATIEAWTAAALRHCAARD